MTGPASGGTERGTGAPSRATGTQGAVGAVLLVLALGFALRLIIAYLLPGSGFKVDLGAFRFWADYLATHGPWGFYDQDFLHDYMPGYMYVLWLVGLVGKVAGGVGDLIKIPPILADLAIGWLVYSMVTELGGRRSLAIGGALLAILNPISWFDSVVWGQVDSFGVVFLLLALRELWRDNPERAAIYTVIAAIIKPQLGILVPLVAVVTIRRALWPAGGGGDPDRTGRPIRILTTGLAGLATAVVLSIPFGLSPVGFVRQLLSTGGTYPFTTVNAYNPWSLVVSDLGRSPANSGGWICDAAAAFVKDDCGFGTAFFGPIPAIVVGTALLLAAIAIVLAVAAYRPDRLTLLVALAALALAFFILPTRVHERYGYPFFALAVILAAVSRRWLVAYLVLSLATFANMYVVLTTLYTDNPSIHDWLGIGEAIRSEAGITLIVALHAVGFAWVLWQLRPAARARLADEVEEASAWPEPPVEVTAPGAGREVPAGAALGATAGGPAVAVAVGAAGAAGAAGAVAVADRPVAVQLPTWSRRPGLGELGIVGWIRSRWDEPSIRPDRSAALRNEGGGRLDRLDLWFLLVLVLASMTLRMFRLAEPYQMHFDEVYHARTAAEFLQDWRYGESHDIYEWTHPHLAKYAMAAGLVLWGEDHVASTSELGVPVRAAVVEPRRDDADAPLGRAGERLHVATGTEIRTYDLRSRLLISTIPAPGVSALAIDPTGLQLVVGYDDGRLATVDLTAIDTDAAAAGVEPVPLGTVRGPVTHLLVPEDGTTVAVGQSDRLDIVDLADGTAVGGMELPGLIDLADAGSGDILQATLADVTDPAAEAAVLAISLEGTAATYEAALKGDGEIAFLGSPSSGKPREAIEAAIADGKLPGIEIAQVSRIAAASPAGVTFVDPVSGLGVPGLDPTTKALTPTIALDGGAHGVAFVTGLDDDKLYVTTGTADAATYHVIVLGGDTAKDGPRVDGAANPLPGLGSSIVYDPASQMVHILGLAPDAPVPVAGESAAGPWTVYVIEPHGNAVFADARLADDYRPVAVAADVNAQYPSDDRQDLLVLDGKGSMASIEMGSHAFAWRLPGVIAGTLTLVCLYLLARILFRRRLVAGLVGLFVLADGMFFVQSRIGMNDVYVGLFIVAAYTVFAAVWTGWWRGRFTFVLALPVIGVLLGLALASKWVALYAMAGIALLILVRSALGRVVAILGMIGVTAVLGYMAISVPDGQGFGNLTFLLVMVALTLLAIVVAIFHPIAWTDEEMRLAVIAPAALGALVFFGALAAGRLDTQIVIRSIAVTPLLVAILLALGSLAVWAVIGFAGRLGFGPMASPPGPDDPARRLEPPAPAPEGWLRPGWLLGLPIVWAAICLVALPLALYVVSYIPWAMVENHRLFADITVLGLHIPAWPPGHDGQTLLDLTQRMYGYHNGLTTPHPASSPWWAWPLNLKPVWFYQEGLAGGTAAAIYDAGNLVIWWLGAAALVFVSVVAFRRRSAALALIAMGFAFQWIPWARIDRAAFQYHYYTALPFVVLALAYFIAEIWEGASRFTWQFARLAGAVALSLPAAMWLLSRPLCALVGVESVNPGSAACPAVIPEFVLTTRTAGLAIVAGIGLFFVIRAMLAIADADRDEVSPDPGWYRRLVVTGLVVGLAFVGVSLLPDTAILTLNRIPVEPIVLLAALPLGYLAFGVIGGRDPRRYVVGYLVAVVAWGVVLYPNIAALPMPSILVNAYQGIVPTYLYSFQFPVSKIDRNLPTPIFTREFVLLLVTLTITCLVVAYSAWVWRLSLADSDEADETGEADAFARSGGA